MDPYRFFLPALLPLSGDPIPLPDDQAHHARAVLRLDPGTPILLFDGQGHWTSATLHAAGKTLSAQPTGELHTDAPPPIRLTLATAIPKGDRAEWLVDQASQLNVSALQWLDADRSVVKPKEGGNKLAKWRRIAIESAKQCHRTHLMHIHEPLPLDQILTRAAPHPLLWLEPRDAATTRPLAAILQHSPAQLTALIGPEGGWSDREYAHLNALADAPSPTLTRIRLTPTILRIETACTAIAAIINSRVG
ncbi:MAG TPA: RsmE family RNA methyltransferase [Phycisphaerae bacterium]|nr:RsmE family RNA methyltransferase [Phycisphaerae bacterium]